jgi:NAD(P)-dependent dehydrogenase (short-subunit alcohol dehydrogenase family)
LDTAITKNKTAYADYLLSKKSLAEFTKLAAVQFAPHIRVNGIAPGLILPPRNKTNNYLNRLARNVPLKKKGTPNQIALSIQYLLESEYITGEIIFVDGGEHLK